MLTLKQQWNRILKEHNDLSAMASGEYDYKRAELLKTNLKKFLDGNFCFLPKQDILLLGYLVYKYQPIQLHSFLMKCEKQYEILKGLKATA